MKQIKLDSVQKQNKVALDLYKIDLNEIITNIYHSLCNDTEFTEMLNQILNHRNDLYIEYRARLTNLVMGLIDPENAEHPFTAYNLMTDDEVFYRDWSDELFDIIFNEYRYLP